jgi:hypothetical protein
LKNKLLVSNILCNAEKSLAKNKECLYLMDIYNGGVNMKNFLRYFFAALLTTGAFSLNAAQSTLDKQTVAKYVADTQKVVDAYLVLIDQGKYGESWDVSSSMMKKTMPRNEWITVMNTIHKPLGAVKSRKIIDIGTAENPKGLPAGEYMVYYYQTVFANKEKATELITLELGYDQIWRVLTYQVLTQ